MENVNEESNTEVSISSVFDLTRPGIEPPTSALGANALPVGGIWRIR